MKSKKQNTFETPAHLAFYLAMHSTENEDDPLSGAPSELFGGCRGLLEAGVYPTPSDFAQGVLDTLQIILCPDVVIQPDSTPARKRKVAKWIAGTGAWSEHQIKELAKSEFREWLYQRTLEEARKGVERLGDERLAEKWLEGVLSTLVWTNHMSREDAQKIRLEVIGGAK